MEALGIVGALLLVFVILPILLGKWIKYASEWHPEPPEPSIFDNTIPPGSSPLTAERVRAAALRLVEREEEPPLWGEPVPMEDGGSAVSLSSEEGDDADHH